MTDGMLMLFLNNQGRDCRNSGQRIKHQNLGFSLCVSVIDTPKKFHDHKKARPRHKSN